MASAPDNLPRRQRPSAVRRLLAALVVTSGAMALPACGNVDSQRPGQTGASAFSGAPTVQTSLRRNPGHYVSLNRTDTLEVIADLKRPGIRGFQRRHTWRTLEPAPGRYDFDAIREDLASAKRYGLQYVILVEDKTFTEEIPTPEYLAAPPQTLKNRNRGYTAARWRPEVAKPYRELVVAMAREFDSHPNFEGIGIQETALSLANDVLASAGYSAIAYQSALSQVLEEGSAALKQANLFWYMNFLPAKQRGLADIIEQSVIGNDRVIVGGPDVLPGKPALTRHTYPLYEQFRGQVTFFNSMQFDSYAHERKQVQESPRPRYWSLAELTEFARDELGVSYLFWNRKTWRKPADSHAFEDAFPIFSKYPKLATMTIGGRCSGGDCAAKPFQHGDARRVADDS